MTERVKHPSPALVDRGIQISLIRSLVEWNQWLTNLYSSLPSQALGIIRIRQWLVWLSIRLIWLERGYQVMVLVAWVSQYGKHYKGHWATTFTSRYLPWCDLRRCQDVKLLTTKCVLVLPSHMIMSVPFPNLVTSVIHWEQRGITWSRGVHYCEIYFSLCRSLT